VKRTILHAFAATLLVCCTAGAIAPMDFDSPEQRERFQALTEELRCLVCQNQSLADSDADLAQDMRREVLKLMKAGHSDDEIRAFLVERYGDFVLYNPPVEPSTWLLWFGPGLLVLVGITALLVALRRRRHVAATEDGSNQ
jgi:cytochrome c-type biogenesis protein CcmH